jgi:hypothetical protein
MNGWQRLMVVVSGLWSLCVAGYYYYEYINFPVEHGIQHISIEENIQKRANNFYLISIKQISAIDDADRPKFEKDYRDAATPEEKQFYYKMLNDYWRYESATNWGNLSVFLFLPIFLFLALSSSILWVTQGFKKSET